MLPVSTSRAGLNFTSVTTRWRACRAITTRLRRTPRLARMSIAIPTRFRFICGTGLNANFVIDEADQNWVELGIGAQFGQGPVQFGVGFDTTIGRNTANAQVFRASATYRF